MHIAKQQRKKKNINTCIMEFKIESIVILKKKEFFFFNILKKLKISKISINISQSSYIIMKEI